MVRSDFLPCDGCGQAASPEHAARRLKRLEWATRFRPVHIQVLLLGAVMPERPEEFLYAPEGAFAGEAAWLLEAAGIAPEARGKEAAQAELQRAGLFATHVLECPVDHAANDGAAIEALLERRIPAVLARIRRSLKPKRLALISSALDAFRERFTPDSAACDVILTNGRAFDLAGGDQRELSQLLQETLAARRNA